MSTANESRVGHAHHYGLKNFGFDCVCKTLLFGADFGPEV